MLNKVLSYLRLRKAPPVVAVVSLTGVIGAAGGPLRRDRLSLADLAPSLERAFKLPHLSAVALTINSPGGSPVQSALIHTRIRQLAEETDIQVFAFTEDLAASGGYWLACAADQIFADASSLLGSIGVVYQGFGFQDLITRYGVERRIHTMGTRKAMLDPFQQEKTEDVERLQAIQADVHEAFKDLVRTSRGDRLKGSAEELFNGDIWTGRQALQLGLIDAIGDMRSVMREHFGDEVKLVAVRHGKGWLRQRLKLGAQRDDSGLWADSALAAIEERLMWSRFGL